MEAESARNDTASNPGPSSNLLTEASKSADVCDSPENTAAALACAGPLSRRTRSALRAQNSPIPPRLPSQPVCCFCPSDRAHLPPPQISGGLPGKTDRAGLTGKESGATGAAEKKDDGGADAVYGSAKRGELLGPFSNPKSVNGKRLYVHFECACWAPQVYTDPDTNQLRRVHEEYQRGRQLRCSQCFHRGATVGCYVHQCKKVFHYCCLEAAGAFKVNRFFVAFCDVHAHLGNKTSYNILMEAATIADVATARRTKDANHGLDAPHSRFTKLRRMETEVIFSRTWKVTSVPTAFDNDMIIFSHKRRTVFHRSDRYSLGDGLRALRASALEVASGRLAYMAIVGRREAPINLTPVEARAVIASKDNTGVFLLRNLRRSPTWQKGSLCVIKSSFYWDKSATAFDFSPEQGNNKMERVVGTDGLLWGEPYNGSGERVLLVSPKEGQGTLKKKRGRPKRPLDTTPGNSPGILSENDGPSVPLPAFKKPRLALMAKKDGVRTAASQQHDREKLLTDMGLTGRILSSWETFLVEQLPRERVLRPEDSIGDSMRNMARLWSLMTPGEREEYERRATAAAGMLPAPGADTPQFERNDLESDIEPIEVDLSRQASTSRVKSVEISPSAREIGLFSSVGIRTEPERTVNTNVVRKSATNKSKSVSLPRGASRLSRKKSPESASMSLDEMFPVSEDDLVLTAEKVREPLSNIDESSVEPVRPPPPRQGKAM